MLTGTIDTIDLDIAAVINESLTPAARSAALAAFARETLADAEGQNRQALGYTPSHAIVVDGVAGASEDAVQPGGEIHYAFELLTDLFTWILAMLEQFAPVRTGRFKASFELYADSVLVDPTLEIPQASEYVFLSSAVYAREIEGDQSRAPESKQAPNGVFEAVAVLAQQRFGNQANIRFSYRAPFDGTLLTGKAGDRSDTRTPAITITTGV
jgi:hypothetical protein